MITNFLSKIFGSRNERQVNRIYKLIEKINAQEDSVSALDDAALRAKTDEFRQRYQNGETLEQLLPDAFAVVREAGQRTLQMRHFDVQLVGGVVQHEGKISEMRTGEGKTLVATLPAYLNALTGKGVHIITVNDYLAKRDAEWMGEIYRFLGMTVGVIVANLSQEERRAAYAADITYGTNNEFGFDYLRDNMAFKASDRVQRKLHYAIVDEVDSILIDEARTPLIISGPAQDSSDAYQRIDKIIPKLTRQARIPTKDDLEPNPGDYAVDEKNKQVFISDDGHQKIEELLQEEGILAEGQNLYDSANIMLMHHVQAALRAHALFRREVDYIVRDNQVIIVDEFTGRTLPGRRWSEGLHQAVEAKEGVKVQQENQTLASITFQNYFRLYEKLAGMTGTADTEAFEFQQIYKLEVVVIPTHRPMIRNDMPDLVYLTEAEKYEAILEDIKDCQARNQPILVGTVSIENSEKLANMLQDAGVKHQVLNAKFHEHEANIIVQAGRPGTVTIATNMAGRGTDIVLGGNVEAEIKALENPDQTSVAQMRAEWKERHQKVLDAGGLHIIGTERHESRRIDNQLRGRSGRQGDPGSTRFYLSLEDTLMRIFAPDWVGKMMKKAGMERGEAIESRLVSKQIENAQRKVEGQNFDIRKQLLEYDDVANDQRKVIYEQRNDLMEIDDVSDMLNSIRSDVLNETIDAFIPPRSLEEMWDLDGLEAVLEKDFFVKLPIKQWLKEDAETDSDDLHEETLREHIEEGVIEAYKLQAAKVEEMTDASVKEFEKTAALQILDQLWKEHLAAMDYLRQSVQLRGYAQKNPKQEFKREAFEMFSQMLDQYRRQVVQVVTTELFKASERIDIDLKAMADQQRLQDDLQFVHAPVNVLEQMGGEAPQTPAQPSHAPEKEEEHTPFVREQPKVGRNQPCPCGSGKKYKHCHGRLN
jgi:preprotein translocase subunit SecA